MADGKHISKAPLLYNRLMPADTKNLPGLLFALTLCAGTAAAIAVGLIAAPTALGQCHDDAIEFTTDGTSGNEVRFYISSRRTIEASVKLTCDGLDNLTPSHPLPYTFVVNHEYNHYEVLRLAQTNSNQSWHWGAYHYKFVMGIPSNLPTVDYVYSLPYSPANHFYIGQSYFGTRSHAKGTPDQYAVDITMPENTPILAARGGTVIAYRDDSHWGGDSQSFKECCNYVHIKHNDGTYAAYVHLRQNGCNVKLGQVVAPGTIIGYSGSTGWASCPHLHFMVYRVMNPPEVQTLPFRTNTSKGVVTQLIEGEQY